MARLGAFFAAGAFLFVHRHKVPLTGRLAFGSAALILLTMWTGTFQAFAGLPVAYLMLALGVSLRLHRWGAKNDISYGMYIYAFPVQQLLALAISERSVPVWAFAVLSVLLTVPFAWVSWYFIERRAMGIRRPTNVKVLVSK